MTRRLFIKTYGCQMNVYDSGRMADVLGPLGYRQVDVPDGADLVILNTCHIREKAEEKIFSDLGRIRPLKQARRDDGGRMLIAVAGCVAQAEGAEIMRRAPYVDLVLGPQTYHRLPQMITSIIEDETRRLVDTEFPAELKFDAMPGHQGPSAISSFLSVQEGCDKFCTFCVVPYTRGAEYSRPVASIVDEATALIASGARELVLLGQNVNAYHGIDTDGTTLGLGQVIERLAHLPGLLRLRYTTSHPRDVDTALIRAHAEIEPLMPFLHLPIQSGSDAILAAMNRRHSVADYLRLIDRFRAARPDMAFSSDFIVGFPGESDEDFRATLDLVRRVRFASAFSFRYSPRPGTPAAKAENVVPDDVVRARLAELQDILEQQQRQFNAGSVGSVEPVMFDKVGRYPGQLIGRSRYNQGVHCGADGALLGSVVPVRVVGATLNSLAGKLDEAEVVRAA